MEQILRKQPAALLSSLLSAWPTCETSPLLTIVFCYTDKILQKLVNDKWPFCINVDIAARWANNRIVSSCFSMLGIAPVGINAIWIAMLASRCCCFSAFPRIYRKQYYNTPAARRSRVDCDSEWIRQGHRGRGDHNCAIRQGDVINTKQSVFSSQISFKFASYL